MQTPLRLDSPTTLPAEFVTRLIRHRHLFQRHEYLEAVLRHQEVHTIAEDLEVYLRQQIIHGYHCTKEPSPGFFESRGLRQTNVRAHQVEFLAVFGDRFTADEITWIEAAWHDYFELSGQRKLRDDRIWVCLSRSLVNTSDTESFFRFFGGEAVFMPLLRNASIASKLESIGCPVIVEVALSGDVLCASYKMTHSVLSQFHETIRPDAYSYRSEAHFFQSLPPENIIRVTPLSEFLR